MHPSNNSDVIVEQTSLYRRQVSGHNNLSCNIILFCGLTVSSHLMQSYQRLHVLFCCILYSGVIVLFALSSLFFIGKLKAYCTKVNYFTQCPMVMSYQLNGIGLIVDKTNSEWTFKEYLLLVMSVIDCAYICSDTCCVVFGSLVLEIV